MEDTSAMELDGQQAFLFAVYTLIKVFGKDNKLRWDVPLDIPNPKDGTWTFSTQGFDNKTIELTLYEGKEEIDTLNEIQRGSEDEQEEAQPNALWEERFGQEPLGSNGTEPSGFEYSGDGDNVLNGVPEHPDNSHGE